MRANYDLWLCSQGYPEQTISAQIYRVQRVEAAFGALEDHFNKDALSGVIAALTYSTEDERSERPNPTPITIKGSLRANLASYRDAINRYRRFLQGGSVSKRIASPSSRKLISVENPVTLEDFGYDGRSVLATIVASSRYKTVAQAVASLTLFSHPVTVAQTEGKALFPAIRGPHRVGEVIEVDGKQVFLDDNRSPTEAFLWSNGLRSRGRDIQFNHVWATSQDPEAYTALPNLCMTPACIAKLTDTDAEICRLLEYRSFELFSWVPKGTKPPTKPDGFDELDWANPLPPVDRLKEQLLSAMSTKTKNRTVQAAHKLGWLFEPKKS